MRASLLYCTFGSEKLCDPLDPLSNLACSRIDLGFVMSDIELCYLCFTAASLVPALLGILWTGDLFDPRVFLLVYWLSYSSQLSSYFLVGALPANIVEPYTCPVLICAAVSSLVFGVTISLMIKRTPARIRTAEEQEFLVASRNVALLIMLVFSVVILFYAIQNGGLNFHKATFRDSKSDFDKTFYRLLIVVTMLSSMITISLDSQCWNFNRSKIKAILILVIFQIIWCWLMSERNVVLILVLVGALYRGIDTWKIRSGALAMACFMLLFVQLSRSATNQHRRLASSDVNEYVQTKGLPKFSASLTVFTNVVDTVPERAEHFYGSTYLTSLQTFLPGDPLNARKRSIATWFPKNYYYQANSGVDFAIDAEGYVNFGWIGPPIIFGCISLCLVLLYNSRQRFWLAATLYPIVVLVFLGAIRTNSQTTFKMIAGGLVCCLILRSVALIIAPRPKISDANA